ncbi:MAG: hypothetical protein K6C12_04440 [Oscillospiraceae bacterium]|nr:hypothetical protein [Oscillospiraceae bacterium]
MKKLKSAVNTAIKRYPYFAVRVGLDEDGGYILQSNPEEAVIFRRRKHLPKLGSPAVNGHLLFVQCEGREINFYISHALCGGRGAQPWVMTTVYQYIIEKYHVVPTAPAIRKPDSPLLPGEAEEPTIEMLGTEQPIFRYRSKKPAILGIDYLNGMFNPFKRKPNFRFYTFAQKDIMSFVKNNDSSVASFFLVVMAKALDKVLPEKVRVIGGETAHNPAASLGLPHSHIDLLSHVHLDYTREQLKWDMEKLGTMTRGQIVLQTDPSVSSAELRDKFCLLQELEAIRGQKQKLAYFKKHDPYEGKNAQHGTFIANYTGWMDWGEVADYVDSFVFIVDGHVLLEASSLGDRIFLSFMQLLDEKKYTDAFEAVLTEFGIPFQSEGPFPKRLTKHELPREKTPSASLLRKKSGQ